MQQNNPITNNIYDRLRSKKTSFSGSIKNKTSFLWGGIFIIISLISLFQFSNGAWNYFCEICPNTDVLTWDENIRLNIVYDQYSDFQNGNIGSGIKPFFESPTWPPLRSLITFALLFFPSDLLVTELDSFVGLVFLGCAFISLVLIGFLLTKNWLYTGILSLSGFALIFQSIEVSAYSLSSMLETQSMFFLVWCYYFFYRFYSEGAYPQKSTILGFSTFLLLFFFTKYPYGLMLFIALFLIEFLRNRKAAWEGILYSFNHHYKTGRRILLVLVLGMIISIPFLRFIDGVDFNQRSFKLSLYYLSLPVFLDLQYFLWKHKNNLGNILPKSIRVLYLYSFLPAMVWIYGNPDRVSSLLDAQMIVNDHTKSFFLSIVSGRSENPMLPMAVFDDPWGIRILLVISFMSAMFILYSYSHKKEFLKNPLFLVTTVLFLQIFILETTTGNKQQRHILQYIPSLALILWLWIFRVLDISAVISARINRVFQAFASLAFLFSILVLSGGRGLWAGNFFQDRYFCLRGEDKSVFEPVRWADENLPMDKNLLLFNGFHETFNYDKSGRLIASEFDLKIRQSRFRDVMVRHDNKHKWKTWDEFDELVFISYSCDDRNLLAKLEARKKKVGKELQSIQKILHPSGEYCMERWKILK